MDYRGFLFLWLRCLFLGRELLDLDIDLVLLRLANSSPPLVAFFRLLVHDDNLFRDRLRRWLTLRYGFLRGLDHCSCFRDFGGFFFLGSFDHGLFWGYLDSRRGLRLGLRLFDR